MIVDYSWKPNRNILIDKSYQAKSVTVRFYERVHTCMCEGDNPQPSMGTF